MKRWLPILAMLAAATTCRAQTASPLELGPGDRGATLKQPGFAPAPPSTPAAAPPSSLQGLWKNSPAPSPNPVLSLERKSAPTRPDPRMNDDIKVDEKAGEWLILVMAYVADNAPVQARKFVAELRGTYKLNAYTYTYGAEENQKARAEAEKERDKQREALRQAGLTNVNIPYRLRYYKVDEQTGVLIGGYRTQDEAVNDLKKRIRKLNPPDTTKVDLDIKYQGGEIWKEGKAKYDVAAAYVNPFLTAFAVKNPAIKHDAKPVNTAEEIRYLREINAGEPLSLFHCKKPFTLAVKQYNTVAMLQENPNEAKAFLDRLSKQKVDYAAKNAHNVAEAFRKVGLKETYVLHARYCSYVTMGGFDSENDPNLKAMQTQLATYFRSAPMQVLDMMLEPVPMQVPH